MELLLIALACLVFAVALVIAGPFILMALGILLTGVVVSVAGIGGFLLESVKGFAQSIVKRRR